MSKKLLSTLLGITIAIFILTHPLFHKTIQSLGTFGYLGSFIAGLFYTSIFTSIPTSAVFLVLGDDTLNPFLLAIIGGTGAMLGDYILYKVFRSETDGLNKAYIFKSRLVKLAAVIVGIIIIASPFPDEAGIVLIGITKLNLKKFLPISFALNSAGIFILLTLGKIF
ncbi:hypothetical protein HYS29_00355 [Candidatus Microgenomates bacterium]|nr:hypothetical protein [Candidatus Microgenomates bacterium]